MNNQITIWQQRYIIFLMLICIGIGLAHQLESSLEPNHAQHCSVCHLGCNTPTISAKTGIAYFELTANDFTEVKLLFSYQGLQWPDYLTRAPPLV